jgi:phosphoribosyl-dephospho-CoA transferase
MFARHDLVWLSGQGWQRAYSTTPAHYHSTTEKWRDADWPTIVRRTDADLLPSQLSIGITMPPDPIDGCKTRIGLRVARSDISKVLPPLPVAEIIDAAPQAWRSSLAALESDASVAGLTIRAYGSVALHALTRQTYLTAASDIDVLLHPVSGAQLYLALELLNFYARCLPLDGEIVFPNGQAVAWKELSSALQSGNGTRGTRVLVKEMRGVYLARTSDLLATMKDDVCMSS